MTLQSCFMSTPSPMLRRGVCPGGNAGVTIVGPFALGVQGVTGHAGCSSAGVLKGIHERVKIASDSKRAIGRGRSRFRTLPPPALWGYRAIALVLRATRESGAWTT